MDEPQENIGADTNTRSRMKTVTIVALLAGFVFVGACMLLMNSVRNREQAAFEKERVTTKEELAGLKAKNEVLQRENEKLLTAVRAVVLAPTPTQASNVPASTAAVSAKSSSEKTTPAKSALPVPAKSANGLKELPDAIRVHSLAEKDQGAIANEYKEMGPALKECDKEHKLGLALCVMPKQGEYSTWLPVLVTWNDGAVSTIADARKVLACLQKQWSVGSVVNKTEKNAAELVVQSSFTGECIAKPAE